MFVEDNSRQLQWQQFDEHAALNSLQGTSRLRELLRLLTFNAALNKLLELFMFSNLAESAIHLTGKGPLVPVGEDYVYQSICVSIVRRSGTECQQWCYTSGKID